VRSPPQRSIIDLHVVPVALLHLSFLQDWLDGEEICS
jgi:hypothetical protein